MSERESRVNTHFPSSSSSGEVESEESRKRRARHDRDRSRRGFFSPEDNASGGKWDEVATSNGQPKTAVRRKAKAVRAPKVTVEIPSLVSVDVLAKLLGVKIGTFCDSPHSMSMMA
jgi:hypothetical protein